MDKKIYLGLMLLILSVGSNAALCPQWTGDEARQRINNLATEVWRHDLLYHEQSSPEISDAEYDALEQQLNGLQACFPDIPVHRYQPETRQDSLKHHALMGSLKKADDKGDVKKFLEKFRLSKLILQPKIDGIAVELAYKKGILTKAITRGDGESGKNILRHVQLMPLVPQQLPKALDMVLHGELFTRLDRVDKSLLEKYASARHLVAGQLNRKVSAPENLASIDFFPWRWVNPPFTSDFDAINALATLGFKHPLKYTHSIATIEKVIQWRHFYDRYNRENSVFLMDGIVVKSANIADRKIVDNNSKQPDWALAWKFPAKTAVTTVIDIEFSKGKTGKITPVLIISPVTIEGRVIRRVSLGSMNSFREKDIAAGDQVSVMLKGSATPVFGKVILRSKNRK